MKNITSALLVLIFIFTAAQVLAQNKNKKAPAFTQADSLEMKKIILFHNDGCGRCEVAKDFLDENGIPYIGKNIGQSENRREMQGWVNKARGGKSGGFSYPVIVLNEDSVYYSIPNIRGLMEEIKKAREEGKL